MPSLSEIFTGTAQAQTTQTAATPSTTPNSPQGMAGMFMPMILVFVIFYFLMIRPQQRERKKHQELLKNLKKGDQVVTSAGIHGQVTGINDNVVNLEIAENIRIKLEKNQITTVKPAA